MAVLVKLSASLRDHVPGYDPLRGLSLPADDAGSVAAVLAGLGIAPAQAKVIMVNGRAAGLDTPLADGDRLAVFPPVGGG